MEGCSAFCVQRPDEWVDESQGRLPARDARVIQQSHYPSEGGRRTRGAVDEASLPIYDDREVDSLGCYVGNGLCHLLSAACSRDEHGHDIRDRTCGE